MVYISHSLVNLKVDICKEQPLQVLKNYHKEMGKPRNKISLYNFPIKKIYQAHPKWRASRKETILKIMWYNHINKIVEKTMTPLAIVVLMASKALIAMMIQTETMLHRPLTKTALAVLLIIKELTKVVPLKLKMITTT